MAVAPAREEYRRLLETLPFQPIADTPTVRYYTNWKVYQELFDLEYSSTEDALPGFLSLPEAPRVYVGTSVRLEGHIPPSVEVEAIDPANLGDGLQPWSLIKVANKMQAYHAWRWNLGVRVTVDPGAEFGRLVVVSLGGDGYTGHHILFDVGEGASGEIIYVDYAGSSRALKTVVVETRVGPRAKVKLVTLALHKREHAVYLLKATEIGEQAEVDQRFLVSGGRMTRLQEDNLVKGRLAKLESRASNIARPSTATDFILSALHYGPESEGVVRSRGVVIGDGYLAQRGVAMLGESARWASSEVESYVFLLSEKGKGYAVPVLEIHTGEVTKAGHSAAVASLGEDILFYLRSRGLRDEEIVSLVMEGIGRFSGVLEELEIPFPELVKF
ncbi:MAG: SufD family Fe-S cluster assembly protein [Desulfurococcales archaeon]|nr:SufD family Fe-S cluster assembly protein [Desulfurococcales archaeon]